MTPSDFGGIHKIKRFSIDFEPQTFSYWDYREAWYRAFWYKNSSGRHSWMFYFKRNTIFKFPYWFSTWWQYFGAIPEIFPSEVQKGFELFIKHTRLAEEEFAFQKTLLFCSKFFLSWISLWEFVFIGNTPPLPCTLGKVFKVKWWDDSDASGAYPSQVQNWLNQKTQFPAHLIASATDREHLQFLSQKSHMQAEIAAASSQEDFQQTIERIFTQLSTPSRSAQPSRAESEGSNEDIVFSQDLLQENEDVLGLTETQYESLYRMQTLGGPKMPKD